MPTNFTPDKNLLIDHFDSLFRYASAGLFISHRVYTEAEQSHCLNMQATQIGSGNLIEDAITAATLAANHASAAVYCPPLAGFSSPTSASEKSLVEAYTFTADFDQHPSEGLARLEACLGVPTMVVATGGEWLNQTTGVIELKVHVHWRLTEPATGDDLTKLKNARKLAAHRVGADATGASLVHCFRAPGSFHRKGEPKLAMIVAHNPEVEIELSDIIGRLDLLSSAPWVTEKANPTTRGELGTNEKQETDGLLENILSATSYHDPLLKLSARWAGAGMYPGAIVNNLRALMNNSSGPRDDRWTTRHADIPRIVESAIGKFGNQWPEPKPLANALLPVKSFDPVMIPNSLREWVVDIADRMQCPIDYVAVSVMVALGGVIGRRVGIRAQEHTDWTEIPNLWGMVVGRPGVMKSPAMNHALKPLRRLDATAAERNAKAKEDYEADLANHKPGNGPKPPKPTYIRYIVNDTSYEALGEVMADNPNGVLVYRDELISLLKPLAREDQAPARGFYLTAWNGNEGYTFDRILRGRVHIPACCLSLLGATQPSKLSGYLIDAVNGGDGDDGFAQRFGLLVWPEVSPSWKDIDREPDGQARRRANQVFDRLDGLDPASIGARVDEFDPIPYLRFSPDALAAFRHWREDLELRLRGGELTDTMTSHLNKFRGLVPSLALIMHLAEGARGPVSLSALLSALAWAEYLETHAARAYASVTSAKLSTARTLSSKIKGGHLSNPFTARDVYGKGWSGLNDAQKASDALQVLVDHDWLREEVVKTGGHPKKTYSINPKALPQ